MRKRNCNVWYIFEGGFMKEAIIIHLDEPEAEAETFIAYMPG